MHDDVEIGHESAESWRCFLDQTSTDARPHMVPAFHGGTLF